MLFLTLLVAVFAAAQAAPGSRIVGGSNAVVGKFTHQASLQATSGRHFCGGSLVAPNVIATAAHCVEPPEDLNFRVVLGLHDHDDYGSTGAVTVKPKQVIAHPDYKSGSGFYPNDVAVIILETDVPLSDSIALIDLANGSPDQFDGKTCDISGWGVLDADDANTPRVLQEAQVVVLTDSEGTWEWGSSYNSEAHICVDARRISACFGDSGGPLTCEDNTGTKVLAGMASWVQSNCDGNGRASTYARATSYYDFISPYL